MNFNVKDGLIEEIEFDNAPNMVGKILAALGMTLP
jgi:hypothetical protein